MLFYVFWMYQSVFDAKNELEGGKIRERDWLGGCCSKQAGDDDIQNKGSRYELRDIWEAEMVGLEDWLAKQRKD